MSAREVTFQSESDKQPSDPSQSAAIKDQLQRIFQSDEFSRSPKLRKLLSYLVDQATAGYSRDIKGYAIGIDVFDRDEDFDTQNDPIVRVNMGRLRSALEHYYSQDGGADPIIISFERGNYIPRFEIRDPSDRPRRASAIWIALGGLILLGIVLVTGISGSRQGFPGQRLPTAPPMLYVEPFTANGDANFARRMRALQIAIPNELARYSNLRVLLGNPPEKLDRQGITYRLMGDIIQRTNYFKVNLSLLRAGSNEIVWGNQFTLPASEAEFDKDYSDVIFGLTNEIAGEFGALKTDIRERMDQQIRMADIADLDDFYCQLVFYSFDMTRNRIDRRDAWACLEFLTVQGTPDANTWGAWALMNAIFAESDVFPGASILQARAAAIKAVGLDSDDPLVHEYFGAVLSMAGEYEAAKQAYQRAINLSWRRPSLLAAISWQLALAGEWDQGIDGIERAVALDPGLPPYFRIPLAFNAYGKGRYQAALDIAETLAARREFRALPIALAAAIKMNNVQKIEIIESYIDKIEKEENLDIVDMLYKNFSKPDIYNNIAREIRIYNINK